MFADGCKCVYEYVGNEKSDYLKLQAGCQH